MSRQRSRSPLTALVLGTALTMASEAPAAAAELKPETLAAWRTYVAATEERRAREARHESRFLVLDFGPEPTDERRAVRAGEVVIESMRSTDAAGEQIDIPSGLVHHWRGAVFIAGTTVGALMERLQEAPPSQKDVLESAVLARGPGSMQVFLRLRRTRLVTAVYDTVHDVTFTRRSRHQWESRSVATRIVEIEAPGTPDEQARPEGVDRGFLWRLNAYWRYEEVPGGVIAECESVSLSRSVPFGLRTLTGPLISGVARESMEAALEALVPLGAAGRVTVGRTTTSPEMPRASSPAR